MSTALAAARAKTKGKRMLRDALEAYGEEEYTLSEWNALKQQATQAGKWRWKASDTSATLAAVKGRVQKDAAQATLDQKFATDLDAVMAAELHSHSAAATADDSQQQTTEHLNQCGWRERIGGKPYACGTVLPLEKKSKSVTSDALADQPNGDRQKPQRRLCKWHARECVCVDHAIDKSRAIEIPNDQGFCMACYESTALKDRGSLQKTPPRLPATRIPGVSEIDLKREVQRQVLLRGATSTSKANATAAQRLTAQSVCAWEKEHSQSAFVWRCRNTVVMHPRLRGAFLPFCGYHAPRCIQEYGASGSSSSSAKCPAIERRNPLGMCRNHVEAQLSTLPFDVRALKCKFVDSEFDVPGIVECRRDRLQPKPRRHPLAPRDPPPSPSPLPTPSTNNMMVAVKPHTPPLTRLERLYRQWTTAQDAVGMAASGVVAQVIASVFTSQPRNPVTALLQEIAWRITFARRASVVATRIQRIFRGNRARRRVRAMQWEHAALQRLRATLTIQRIARGHVGRLAFTAERQAVHNAVPDIQRVVRGFLARRRRRRLRAALCVQRCFRAYRQRCLAWAMREEMAYMRLLQREADANYEEMLVQVAAFRRLRARRILRAHVAKWRRRKEEQARMAAQRLQSLLSAVTIQRAYRRYQKYKLVKRRYTSAQQIQRRVRGWLTRHLWKDDPGVVWKSSTGFVNPLTGVEYGKYVVLAQPSRSYAFPSRVIRMQAGCAAIQRVYRGFLGRMVANMRWVAMLKRWEWLGLATMATNGSSEEVSTDSMTLGHDKYGFLLPSNSYHRDKKRHMIPIKRSIKPDRGFAYKYQNILELLQDRDGKRAWSLAREAQWTQRATTTNKNEPRHEESATSSPSPAKGGIQPLHHQQQLVELKMIPIAQALYPVGCVVLVASTNRRDRQRFHKARIVAVHSASGSGELTNHASTFDVEYLESFLSERGVRVYTEPRVAVARLRPVGKMTPQDPLNARRRRRPVGKLIQSAIEQLQHEIQASRQQRQSGASDHEHPHEDGSPLASVDAIVARLREEHPLADLLQDQRDFVNFVFQNSQILRTKWLQVIDHVRYGTRDAPLPSPTQLNQRQPLPPSLLSFYQEFGFKMDATPRQTPSPTAAIAIHPMPERARDMEQRMAALGFRHDPSANIKDDDGDDDEKKKTDDTWTSSQRPQTTPLGGGTATSVNAVRDDLALVSSSSSSSAQDLHRLIYELKTLPRERHREQILAISTRHARSFVCGVPACGRCFSSHEAARLHQQQVHLHQRRLATATPLVDQYLHAYWPPQSPWNQELHRSFTPSVGYYQCSHADCSARGSDAQFRTRRELQRHVTHVHQGHRHDRTALGEELTQLSSPLQQSPLAVSSSSLIWLGAYSMCRSQLESRLDGFPTTATWHGSDVIQCEPHAATQPDRERCRECFLQTRRLVLPCRLYRTVALPVSRAFSSSSRPQQQQLHGEMEGYVIFSVEDPLLCPVVREQDLVSLDESDAQRKKRLIRQQLRTTKAKQDATMTPAPSLVFLRLQVLCRDANNVSWAIGHVFRSVAPSPQSLVEPLDTSSYEVVLDTSHVVAVAVEDIRASCVVHRCSTTVFQRKHFHRDDPLAIRRLAEPRHTKRRDDGSHGLHGMLARYWRDNGSEETVDDESEHADNEHRP